MSEPVQFKSIDEAIEAYVATRDELRAKQQAFKLEEDAMKLRMEQISMWLRDKADELGVDSFKTQFGTAYRSVKTSYRVATGGWDAFIGWVKETGKFQCLEKRVAKLAIKEIHDDTGAIPPGLDYVAEVEFDVRRPTKAKA